MVLGSLWQGVGPRTLWIGLGGSIFFGVLEKTKELLARSSSKTTIQPAGYAWKGPGSFRNVQLQFLSIPPLESIVTCSPSPTKLISKPIGWWIFANYWFRSTGRQYWVTALWWLKRRGYSVFADETKGFSWESRQTITSVGLVVVRFRFCQLWQVRKDFNKYDFTKEELVCW